MNSFFDSEFWGNSVKDWAICIGIIAVSIVVARLFQSVFIKKLQRLSEKTATDFDDFVVSVFRKYAMPLAYLLCVYFGLKYVSLPEKTSQVIQVAVTVVCVFYIIRGINAFIRYFFYSYMNKESPEEQKKKQVRGILLLIHAFVWVLGIVFLIDNLGYDISTIVAGLGIGGIAIALASQAILGDLFSYLVIFFDKPFEIGDFIIVDDKIGVVEYIGIKTTRIKTLSGEQLVCSNTDLTNSRVHNFKKMEERRVLFSFGVIYDTPSSKLKKIPGMVKRIIESQKDTRFDRAHFFSFGDYSLNFEVVYYVHSADYNIYMNTQQAINLSIFEKFEQENIEFAFPTQTLLFQKNNPQAVNN